MPIELKMPALSPTMEEGTLAKWLVKEGDDGEIRRHPRRDRDRQGDDGVRSGRRRHDRQDPGPRGHRRREGRRADRDYRGRRRRRSRAAAPKARGKPRPARAARKPAAEGGEVDADGSARRTAPVERPGAAAARRSASREGDRIKASPLAKPPRAAQSIDLPRSRAAARAAASSAPTSAALPAAPAPPARRRRCARARTHARHARAVRAGDPARGGQALQHAQDHRPPPDRIEAAGPAHLSDGRHPARRAAQAARRAQQGPREPRHQAQRQRPDDQGARPGADRGARMQRQLRRRPFDQIQPRRHFGRGVDPGRADHADRRRRREQERVGHRHRDEGPRRPRQGGQAPAARISGRHRVP